MSNRFELLETTKTAFGTDGRLLGAWTNKAGTEITQAADDDVTEADLDALPAKGIAGALLLRETVGPPDKKVRVFQLSHLEFLKGTDAVQKLHTLLYVVDWGKAEEKAYWQIAPPTVAQVPTGKALKDDLIVYVEGLVGKVPPSPFTGIKIIGYDAGGSSQDKTCFDVIFRIETATNTIKKVPAIICVLGEGTEADPYTFTANIVG